MKVNDSFYQNQTFVASKQPDEAPASKAAEESALSAAAQPIEQPASQQTSTVAPLAPRTFDAINEHVDALISSAKSNDAAAISEQMKKLSEQAPTAVQFDAQYLKQNAEQFNAAQQVPAAAQFAALLA